MDPTFLIWWHTNIQPTTTFYISIYYFVFTSNTDTEIGELTPETTRICDLNMYNWYNYVMLAPSSSISVQDTQKNLHRNMMSVMSFSELNNIQSLCRSVFCLCHIIRINCFTRQCVIGRGRGRVTSHLSIIVHCHLNWFLSIPAKIFRNLIFLIHPNFPALCSELIAQLIIRLPMRLPAPSAWLSPPSAMFLPEIPSVFISFLSRPVSRLNSKR